MPHKVEPQRTSAATLADRLSIKIEELRSAYASACRQAARTRDAADNERVESLREQLHQTSQRFQVLTHTNNELN